MTTLSSRPRTDLQTLLETILGSRNVYFQPPANFKLTYPCIVYTRNKLVPVHADNKTYLHRKRYSLTLIDKNPDSAFVDAIDDIPYCSHTRHFVADNMNHDVYDLYW